MKTQQKGRFAHSDRQGVNTITLETKTPIQGFEIVGPTKSIKKRIWNGILYLIVILFYIDILSILNKVLLVLEATSQIIFPHCSIRSFYVHC